MTKIIKEIDNELNLTIYTVKGDFELNLIFELIDKFYQSSHTLNLAWNLSEANLSKISLKEIQRIQYYAKKYNHLRKNGKTAFILSTDINFGIGRMYESIAEINNHHITHHVFRRLDDAINWFK